MRFFTLPNILYLNLKGTPAKSRIGKGREMFSSSLTTILAASPFGTLGSWAN